MKFKCTECKPDSDFDTNNLELIVKDGVTHKFNIKPDGSLEHIESDGEGQEIYLQCPYCGKRYDFISEDLILEEKFVLNKQTINKQYNYFIQPICLEDLKFKLRE